MTLTLLRKVNSTPLFNLLKTIFAKSDKTAMKPSDGAIRFYRGRINHLV